MTGTTQNEMPSPGIESRCNLLAECQNPLLIGVRHHSAILSARMPSMLEEFGPERICIELPAEFQDWIEWIAHKDAQAPIALAASGKSGELYFYPLADFSPELAAIRWAVRNKVPVELIDLPLRQRGKSPSADAATETNIESEIESEQAATNPELEIRPEYIPWLPAIQRRLGSCDTEILWERMVESPGVDGTPDSVRTAALLFGLIVRDNSKSISIRDRMREAWMRFCLGKSKLKTVAVIGSFHAQALLPKTIDQPCDDRVHELFQSAIESTTKDGKSQQAESEWTSALIPYSFSQLDSRSGYPAGVLDPVWHQSIWESSNDDDRKTILRNVLVEICRDLRKRDVTASTAEAISAHAMALDLSRLRQLATPGRSELHEAIVSTLVQGEQIGRRRSVSAATCRVLVGHRLGQLPADSPRSGLVPHVEDLLRQLRLPGPESATQKSKRLRLDSLRNQLDRARAVTLQRMSVLNIPYANRLDQRIDQAKGTRENLTEHWEVDWHHATTARLYTLVTQGVNLQQAVTAAIRRWSQTEEDAELKPEVVLKQLVAASKCGVGEEVNRAAERINTSFGETASLVQIVEAANWYQRICNGLVPGLPLDSETGSPPTINQFDPIALQDRSQLLATSIARLEGVTGSDSLDDARAILELTSWVESGDEDWPVDGGLRFQAWLVKANREGSPLMQGVALGCQMQLSILDPMDVKSNTTSWWDQASASEGRRDLAARLTGWLFAAASRVIGDPVWMQGIDDGVCNSTDSDFLERLLPLHFGFRSLPAQQRKQLLQAKLADLPSQTKSRLPIPKSPITVAANRGDDRLARQSIARILPQLELRTLDPQTYTLSEERMVVGRSLENKNELLIADRWQLILGGQPDSPRGRRIQSAFGELIECGSEGSGGGDDLLPYTARSGGSEAPEVDSRKWAKQLEALLGSQIAEEVLVEAAAKGRLAAFQVINPKRTPASPELLRQILAMHSQAEAAMLQHLREIAKNIAERLAKMLAIRLRTHLTGLMTTRPRRRPSPMLDLARTLGRNLKHTYYDCDRKRRIVAADPIFRTPASRNMDWSIHLVVDVSGSMETSTVYAALVAAVFANLPAIDLQFIAFSTEVADLSQHAADPLSLLTEVRIGGGTHIALGLRAAREAIRVPRRAMVVLITDFHEGVSVPELIGEVRALANGGVKLLGLAALDDQAATVYHTGIAQQCVSSGMPVASLAPEQLAQWVAKQIRG